MRHNPVTVVTILAAVAVAMGVCEVIRWNDDIFFEEYECVTPEKFTMIVPGWKESCQTEWAVEMVSNFMVYRGGCIICMDYSKYSKTDDYFGELVPKFELVVDALLGKLREMENRGFDSANGHLFGFSFGAQSSIEAGRRFGLRKINRIDVCEPAGPGFDSDRVFSSLDTKAAAKNIQCIHTSRDKGTYRRECHQDWNMGNCGANQVAAGKYPKGSHGLCPYFYNSAFQNEFRPIPKPRECFSLRAVVTWPVGFRMGYFSNTTSGITGELYARTTKAYPYNELPNEV